MTPEELLRIISDERDLDPASETDFYFPLLTFGQAVEHPYSLAEPPPEYSQARSHAARLWECNDDQDMRDLAAADPEGAAQLFHACVLLVFERFHVSPDIGGEIEPTPDKPYSALAYRALRWLDELEKRAPGRTRRIQ